MLVMYLMVSYMTGFDTHHEKFDRIYRIVTKSFSDERWDFNPGVPVPLAEAARTDFPELERVTMIRYVQSGMITINPGTSEENKFQESTGIGFTDDNLYQILDRPWLAGDPKNSLTNAGSVVLSRKLAMKYFGSLEVLGQSLNMDGKYDLLITGVMEDYPLGQTDFPFEMLISLETITQELIDDDEGWNSTWSDNQVYVLLAENESIDNVIDRMPAFRDKYHGPVNPDDYRTSYYEIHPLADVHFDKQYSNLNYRSVSRENILAFMLVGIFLLSAACVNFINLATAQAVKRAKEVGVKKVLGSRRSQLVTQFLLETLIITTLSLLIALGLTELSLIKVNNFLNLNLDLDFGSPGMWLFLVSLTVGVTFVAGFYPALVLSGFKPLAAIKTTINDMQSGGLLLRRSLVVFQFFISQVLLIGIVVITSQMNYVRNAPLGFDKEGILNIYLPTREISKQQAFKNRVSQLADVKEISLAATSPASTSTSRVNFEYDKEGESKKMSTLIKIADANYLKTYGIQLLAGNGLPDSDTLNGYLLNESLTKSMGYASPEEVVGEYVSVWGREGLVHGVVSDFHTASMRRGIESTALFTDASYYSTMGIVANFNNISALQAQLESIHKELYPGYDYSYQFMDVVIENFYTGEIKMSTMLKVFAAIAVIIGCLGLLGLVSFMANRKIKEIGIRKVMGATVNSILGIFFKEFLKLLVIAFAIATPLSYFGLETWLQEFTYRSDQTVGMYVIALAVTVVIAIATVGYQALKAAGANPVNSLRTE